MKEIIVPVMSVKQTLAYSPIFTPPLAAGTMWTLFSKITKENQKCF